jgi:cytochrome P450 family 6
VNDIVALRIKDGNTRKDFMQLLVQLKQSGKVSGDDSDTADTETEEHPSSTTRNLLLAYLNITINWKICFQSGFDDEDIVAQAVLFFFAGFETSSSTLTYALMELARSPQVQQKARENINDSLKKHNGKMSYDALQDMNYLDWIVQGDKSFSSYP